MPLCYIWSVLSLVYKFIIAKSMMWVWCYISEKVNSVFIGACYLHSNAAVTAEVTA